MSIWSFTILLTFESSVVFVLFFFPLMRDPNFQLKLRNACFLDTVMNIGFVCYDPNNRRVHTSRNVIFWNISLFIHLVLLLIPPKYHIFHIFLSPHPHYPLPRSMFIEWRLPSTAPALDYICFCVLFTSLDSTPTPTSYSWAPIVPY